MIIFIPIILLRKSLLRLSQKLRILAFLCLNAFCIAIALSRMAGGGYYNHDGKFVFRVVYNYILMHLEACIAIIMGGVTAFRTVKLKRGELRLKITKKFTFITIEYK